MKKIILLFTIILLTLILCACGLTDISIPPIPTATPAPVYTTVPTFTPEPTIVPAELENKVIIRINEENKTAYDPEYGTIPIMSFRCQLPVVLIDNNKEAEEKINNTLQELNADYIASDNGEIGLELDKYNELLSLAEGSYSSENEIVQEFKFARLTEILRADDNIICIKFTNSSTQFGTETVSEEYHYFDSSSGTEIDESLVSDETFPVADKKEHGKLELVDNSSSDINIIDLVTIDDDGDTFLLSCDGIIYDLYIGNDWYCNVLNNEAVQINTKIPEGMPNLLISYSSAGDLYNFLLAKDLETNKVYLADYDSITVVG